MLLRELFEEVIWQDEIDGEMYQMTSLMMEGSRQISFGKSKAGRIAAGGLAAIADNPGLAGMAAGYAISALNKYRKNRKYTTRFYAKTPVDKKFYQKLVDDLLKTNNYRTVRTKMVDGGKLWELERIKT
jgi:hypothetical protein